MYSCTPPTTSYYSGLVADDKLATYFLLREVEGVKQPDTLYIKALNSEMDQKIKDMIKHHKSVVVKPVDGAHGHNVFVGVNKYEDVKEKILQITSKDKEARVIIQQQLRPKKHETRVICIDYHFVAAFARIPASVTGDGEHTASELVKIENSTIRTAPYQSDLGYIDERLSRDYLQKTGMANYIPAKDEKFQVVAMCNIGCGGTVKDISNQISQEQRAVSEAVAKKIQLPVIGIDYLDDYILEVNSTPSLFYPTGDDSSTLCVEKLANYLDTI